MARPNKSEREAKVFDAAIAEFNRTQAACQDERRQCLEDRRFLSIPGAQWEGALGEQFANKPRFEVNKAQLGLIRIYNEYRNNRVIVDFRAKDGSQNEPLADMCDALFRADFQDSCGEEAADNAFEEACAGGFGGWRLCTEYENEDDPEDERQRIRFEPIYDADTSVFFDVDAKRQDKSDAKRAWVITAMTPEAFKAEYNQDPATWPKDNTAELFDWNTPNVVYVAEYYEVEKKTETHHVFIDMESEEVVYTADDLEDMSESGEVEGSVDAGIAMLAEQGTVKVREKRVKVRKVHKYIMSGNGILEDCGYIAGKNIPVIPVYGKRWYVNNVERMAGFVRFAKDAQRIKNMQLSLLAETSALSPIQKPILLPEQVLGHEIMWQQDNLKNYPYLLINPITDAEGNPMPSGPVGMTQPPQIPPALAALLQLTEQDMAEILGNNQQADKMVSNISGKAVEMIQQRTDMQAFIYMSNFSKAMRRCGEVWLSMAKEVYHEAGRKMKGLGEMGDVEGVELGKPMIGKDGKLRKLDMSEADLDVYADVGPSFTSRRDAMARQLAGMMQVTQDPTDMKVLTSLMLFNMDGEGLGDVREFYRKQLVQLGVMQPSEADMEAAEAAAENAQPDPQAELVAALAAKEAALAGKAEADTAYTIARTRGEEADTMKTISEIGAEPPAAFPGEQ
jgi:hypothetical protein